MKKYHQTLVLTMLLTHFVAAQTTVRLQNEQTRSAHEIWQCIVQQFNSSSPAVYVTGSIKEKNAGEVYRARGATFTLVPGTTLLNDQMVQPTEVLLNRLPDGDQLPNGQYWIYLSLFDGS
jgi:hypothetical protein